MSCAEAAITVKTCCMTFTTIKILPQRASSQYSIFKKKKKHLTIACTSCEFGHDSLGLCPRTLRRKIKKNYPVKKCWLYPRFLMYFKWRCSSWLEGVQNRWELECQSGTGQGIICSDWKTRLKISFSTTMNWVFQSETSLPSCFFPDLIFGIILAFTLQ